MRHPLLITLLLLFGHLIAQENAKVELATRFYPTEFKENIEVPGYRVEQTFRLTESSYVVVATRGVSDRYGAGPRLLYLSRLGNRFPVRLSTRGAGESKQVSPCFYRFPNGDIVVLSHLKESFTYGYDAILIQDARATSLGHLAVSGPTDSPENELDFRISRDRSGTYFRFDSVPLVILLPGRGDLEISADDAYYLSTSNGLFLVWKQAAR